MQYFKSFVVNKQTNDACQVQFIISHIPGTLLIFTLHDGFEVLTSKLGMAVFSLPISQSSLVCTFKSSNKIWHRTFLKCQSVKAFKSGQSYVDMLLSQEKSKIFLRYLNTKQTFRRTIIILLCSCSSSS